MLYIYRENKTLGGIQKKTSTMNFARQESLKSIEKGYRVIRKNKE